MIQSSSSFQDAININGWCSVPDPNQRKAAETCSSFRGTLLNRMKSLEEQALASSIEIMNI
jgi:hypothetical protein